MKVKVKVKSLHRVRLFVTLRTVAYQASPSMGVSRQECEKWKCVHAPAFICPASLCLLVGAFNPFTFKVIIDMYDPITIVLIVLGLFSVDLF